jgi:hypothetical protein
MATVTGKISPKVRQFLLAQKWAVAGLLVSLIATLVLATTKLADAIYFDDPEHQNQTLAAWMTPRYVALSYDLPRPVVFELLGIVPDTDHRRRLDHLAARLGISLEELTLKVRSAATQHQIENSD